MRKYLLAAVAMAAIASPAVARDNAGYIGVEGGVMFPRNQDVDADVDFTDPLITDINNGDVGSVDFKTGYDLDLIGGYDFGMFRIEAELGYKRAKADDFNVDDALLAAINAGSDTVFVDDDFDLDGSAKILSLMGNALLDFGGGDAGFGGYIGGGFGRASVKEFGEKDSTWAWQLIAGAYMPISDQIDVGLKYRYFHTGQLNFSDTFAFTGGPNGSDGVISFDADNRFSSHSVLLSLIYNFAPPAPAVEPAPPPPPPPPPPPATQTCPDGSVILATDMCPAPPPPPPPPPPEPERG